MPTAWIMLMTSCAMKVKKNAMKLKELSVLGQRKRLLAPRTGPGFPGLQGPHTLPKVNECIMDKGHAETIIKRPVWIPLIQYGIPSSFDGIRGPGYVSSAAQGWGSLAMGHQQALWAQKQMAPPWWKNSPIIKGMGSPLALSQVPSWDTDQESHRLRESEPLWY